MSLFLITGMPIVFAFVIAARWTSTREPRREVLLSIFVKGLLCFLPGCILLAIFRGIVGFSLTGFSLYLSLFFRDHLFPLALASGAFVLFQGKLEYPASEEGIVLAVFAFLSGFYALFGTMDFFVLYGYWGAEDLFLLPLLRIAAVLALSMIAPRFYRFQGSYAAAFMGCAAALCLPAAFICWIYAENYKILATILAGAAFCGTAAVIVIRFPGIFLEPRAR
jgi:hypothetical protein